MRGWTEPARSMSSSTRRETRLWEQEMPVHEQRSTVEFQSYRLFPESDDALNANRGFKSGFVEA